MKIKNFPSLFEGKEKGSNLKFGFVSDNFIYVTANTTFPENLFYMVEDSDRKPVNFSFQISDTMFDFFEKIINDFRFNKIVISFLMAKSYSDSITKNHVSVYGISNIFIDNYKVFLYPTLSAEVLPFIEFTHLKKKPTSQYANPIYEEEFENFTYKLFPDRFEIERKKRTRYFNPKIQRWLYIPEWRDKDKKHVFVFEHSALLHAKKEFYIPPDNNYILVVTEGEKVSYLYSRDMLDGTVEFEQKSFVSLKKTGLSGEDYAELLIMKILRTWRDAIL